MTSSRGRRRAGAGDPHGWNALQNYLKVHHGYLDFLRDVFVEDDELEYGFLAADLFEIRGRIKCKHGLFMDVDKTLEVNEDNQVRTIKYSYHAGIEGDQDRSIFRYDNAHRYTREGHDDEHHRHRYDCLNWQEIEPPEWIGQNRWPHLSQVIEELQEWWINTGQYLDLPTETLDQPP